jgi:osmotically-inducible protein OsmY
MNIPKLVPVLAFTLILSGAHSASATVRKCESDSCRDDAKIAMNVQELLDSHSEFGPPKSIRVQSADRAVYLYGLVNTGLEKSTAESVASKAPDVARVVNSIEESN